MPQKIPKILILEDNERFLESLMAHIQKAYKDNVDILTATNPDEAEGQFESHGSTVDVFVTDVMMADGTPSGLDLAARLAPRLPVIVISAFPPESFERRPERLGPVTFLKKSASKAFQLALLQSIQKAVLIKRFDERVKEESRELRSLCLQRHRGAILSVRFRLPDLAPSDLPTLDLRNLDFVSIGFGTGQWQASIEENDGRINAMHDQSLWASFADTGENQDGVQRAVESFRRTCDAIDGESKAGFEQCPFGAACVPGVLVSGVFGRHSPGMPAIVGRLGDIASQMALRALPREIGLARDWLTVRRRNWFDRLPGNHRVETMFLANLTDLVEVTFYRQ